MTEINQYSDSMGQSEYDDLMESRLQFRELLQDHPLLDLFGDETECEEWLERQVVELVYPITKRERLQTLLRQGKEMLKRERQENLPDGERDQKPLRSTGKRFRRFCLPVTVTE